MTRFLVRVCGGLSVFLLFCLVQHRVAHQNAYGVWRSTTGELYRVSARGSRIVIADSAGNLRLETANWVEEGQSFTFRDVEGKGFAVYRSGHDALEIRGERGTSWLRRQRSP